MSNEEGFTYIEFAHGKLRIVKKVKWEPAIGEPVYGRKFTFTDEYGEDWGIVLRGIPAPEGIEEEPAETGEETENEEEPVLDDRIVKGDAVRYFTEEDEKVIAEIIRDEDAFLETCRQRVEHHGLRMKMLGTDIRFDRRKITFHFAAEGRVDFRMLVRDLASIFRCRIELHQIGARDEAKLYIGCGPCGRELCCRTWLNEFHTIGIKMARAQNLPLNPGKISGNCGRLLCCLRFEFETYLELSENLPKVGDQKEFDGELYEVTYRSPLAQTVTIQSLKPNERHKRIKVTNEEFNAGVIKRKK